jgi:tripartite-type tricarboxylate transporter receptor subunit TctC
MAEAHKSPDVIAKLASVQHFSSYLAPAAFREKILQERASYAELVRKAHIKV